MTESVLATIRSYLQVKPLAVGVITSLVLFLPYALFIDLFFEAILFHSAVDLPNPLILLIGGEANIYGRILLAVLLSVLSTGISTFLLLATTNNDSEKQETNTKL